MLIKMKLLVIVGFLLTIGCKESGIDYSLLEDGERVKPPSPWAMVDFFLYAASQELEIPKGAIKLRLSEHLAHEQVLLGVNTRFKSSESIVFTAPNETNEAVPDSETALIDMMDINIINATDEPMCPENPISTEFVRNGGEDKEIILFSATDLACGGNNVVAMNGLAATVDAFALVPSHVWLNADTKSTNKHLEKMNSFYNEQIKEGGALQRGEDAAVNAAIDNFLFKHQMLTGYVAARQQLEQNTDLNAMRTEVFENNDAKHIVIPAVLNAFLNPSVNNRILVDKDSAASADLNTLLMKEAVGGATVRFLQYQQMFHSEEFKSGEYAGKFQEVKGKFGPLGSYIDDIEKNFKANLPPDGKVYTSAADISGPLNKRITSLNTFLKEEMPCSQLTACREDTSQCKQDKVGVCKEILVDFYDELTAPSCAKSGEDLADSDLYILLTTPKIMSATRINKPCDKYNETPLKIIDKHDHIKDGVVSLKKRTMDSLNELQKIHANSSDADYSRDLLKNYYYAAVPVITAYPDKAGELAGSLQLAHEERYKDKKKDEFWQGVAGIIGWVAGGLAVASIVAIFIPPLAAGFATVAGASLTVAGLLTALTIISGTVLGVIHAADWVVEKREFRSLERAIYSGGAGNVQEQAAALHEWHKSRNAAITEGLLIGVGTVFPGRQIIRNAKGFRETYMTKDALKGLGRAVKESPGKVKNALRHPIKSTKGVFERMRDGFSNAVKRAGNPFASIKNQTKNIDEGAEAVVKNNARMTNKSKAIGELEELASKKGRYSVINGEEIYTVSKKELSPNELNELQQLFKQRAGKKDLQFRYELSPDGISTFRLFPKRGIVAVPKELAKFSKKGRYNVINGEEIYTVSKKELLPNELNELQQLFKQRAGRKDLQFRYELSPDGISTFRLSPKRGIAAPQ